MKKNLILIALLFLFSCNNKSKEVAHSNTNCKCHHGIGSDEKSNPIYTFDFSDNHSVSVCGYSENGIVSEFNIFNCKTGNSLTEYDATQSCTINFKDNKLNIIELARLPNNNNWKWENVDIGIQTISIENKSLVCSTKKPLKVTSKISIQIQEQFLDSLENKQIDLETDEILGRLEILSIIGNEKAYKVLIDIKENPNYIIDGAYAEQYSVALARIKWLCKNN